MIQISLFAVIIGICAWICIPSVIPFTMQTFGVFLNFGVLRGKKGTCAVCLYILLGIIGIPVFNGGSSGIGVVLGKTGGYMIGWIFAGLIIWLTDIFLNSKNNISQKNITVIDTISMIFGLIISYIFGTIWFVFLYSSNADYSFYAALLNCVVPFIIPDLIKIFLAVYLKNRLKKIINI